MNNSLYYKNKKEINKIKKKVNILLEKIKIKKLTKSRIYLYTTLSVLLIITAYTLSTMDFGGVNIIEATRHFFKDLKTMFFSPSLSDRYTYAQVFQSLAVTISLAVLTTIIGSFIALFLSFFAAQNLSNKHLSKTIKLGLSFIRAIPTILWVMVFSVVANVGVEAAMRATGASFWKIIFQGVLPSTVTSILSWTFIRFEINFTNAVLVGAAAGAGGIGYDMFMSGTMYFDIREIGVFVYLIFGVAIILEFISYLLRKKYLKN